MALGNYRYWLRAALCTIVIAVSLSAAQSDTLRCDTCNQATMQEEVLALGIGTHYVIDLQNDVVRKFDVSGRCRVDRETGLQECIRISAIERAADPLVVAYVTQVHTLSKLTVNINGGGPNNNPTGVYQVMISPAANTRVQDIVTTTVAANMGIINQMLSEFTFKPPGFEWSPSELPATVTVRFENGSTAVYEFNKNGETWERKANSERDVEGNPVVVGPNSFTNPNGGPLEFEFDGGSGINPWQTNAALEHFLATARRLGIPIVGAPSSRLRLVCVTVGGHTQCNYI
jgi:hypothetical protein